MHRTKVCVAILFCFITFIAKADPVVPIKQGWHWYPSPKKESNDQRESIEDKDTDAMERIKLIQEELERRKAQAVLDPTEKNILNYLTYQREKVLDKASTFSDQFRRVIWAHPEMDYTLERPTNTLAKKVWLEQRQNQETEAIKILGKQYGLFFFFRSDCPYCHRFAPVLKAFAEAHGLTVMPVSLDGGGLPEYPAPQSNQGQFERLVGSKAVVPALVAVNPTTHQVVPLSFGLVTQEELLKRVYVLTQLEVGHDY